MSQCLLDAMADRIKHIFPSVLVLCIYSILAFICSHYVFHLTPTWFCGNSSLGNCLTLTFTPGESVIPLPVGLAGGFYSPL